MSNYLKNGNKISVIADGELIASPRLEAGTFTIFTAPMQPMQLMEIHPFILPQKMYGDLQSKANRIMTTFQDRSESTGVLLVGTKGSGKTLLARKIAVDMLSMDYPVITVPFNCICQALVNFLESIDTPCVVLFDEIDKAAGHDDDGVAVTDCLLSMFDGLSSSKKLYILTANDETKINQQFLNRPGRLFYRMMFVGVEKDAVRAYCEEKLINKKWIDELITISSMMHAFSFDIMKAIVEECNRYHLNPLQALKDLNVAPDMNGNYLITVYNKDGKLCVVAPGDMQSYLDFEDSADYFTGRFTDIGLAEELLAKMPKEEAEAFVRDNKYDWQSSLATKHFSVNTAEYEEIKDGTVIYKQNDYTIVCRPDDYKFSWRKTL